MISPDRFVELARERLRALRTEFGLQEGGIRAGESFVEITLLGSRTSVTVGMDRAEDYRIYVEIVLLDERGQPRTPKVGASSPDEFTGFDLQFVLREAGVEWSDLGDYGGGSDPEIDRALESVIGALRIHARKLVSGDKGAWGRLQAEIASRVSQRS